MPAFPWFFSSMCCPFGMAASVRWQKLLCSSSWHMQRHDTRSNPTRVLEHALERVTKPRSGWSVEGLWGDVRQLFLRGWGHCPLHIPRPVQSSCPARAVPCTRKHSAGVWPSVPGLAHQLGQLPHTSHIARYALIYSYNTSHTSTARVGGNAMLYLCS